MSLIPMLFSNWWENLDRPHLLPAQHFGTGLFPDQMISKTSNLPALDDYYSHILHPFRDHYRSRCPLNSTSSGLSVLQPDKDKFHVVLDVQQFAPDEITVKVVDDYVVVDGQHEEKRDEHGYVKRQFSRRYLVPEQCDVEQVTSSLSSDGVLTLRAPRRNDTSKTGERVVKIERTGKPAIVVNKGHKKSLTEGSESSKEATMNDVHDGN